MFKLDALLKVMNPQIGNIICFLVCGKELGGNLRKCHWNIVLVKTHIIHFRNNSASNTSLPFDESMTQILLLKLQ